MNDSGLTYEEIQQACRACRWIRITRCPEAYLRDYLASRLNESAPTLAGKIRSLSSDQITGLCWTIKERQDAWHRERQQGSLPPA